MSKDKRTYAAAQADEFREAIAKGDHHAAGRVLHRLPVGSQPDFMVAEGLDMETWNRLLMAGISVKPAAKPKPAAKQPSKPKASKPKPAAKQPSKPPTLSVIAGGGKKKITRNSKGLAVAFADMGIEARFNLRSYAIEIKSSATDWTPLSDMIEARVKEAIEERFVVGVKNAPAVFGTTRWPQSLLSYIWDYRVDPFMQWVEGLPAWDGKPRIETWLQVVFDCDDTALHRWAAQWLFLAPILRAWRPGAKLDESVVLIGEQGCGKSTAVRMVLPASPEGWFADGLVLSDRPKERAEALAGRVIVEASEMAGASRADLESLKAFLTRQDDGVVRLAYARRPVPTPRRCIIVGTANHDCLPNDPTGLRRFAAVRVAGRDVGKLRAWLDAEREQCFAEALALHRKGVHPRLPHSLVVAQTEANETARRKDDVLEDAVAEWCANQPDDFTVRDVAIGCNLVDAETPAKLDPRTQHRIGAALRMAGFRNVVVRADGRQRRLWRKV